MELWVDSLMCACKAEGMDPEPQPHGASARSVDGSAQGHHLQRPGHGQFPLLVLTCLQWGKEPVSKAGHKGKELSRL
jgi:hypothetical protein